MKHKWAQRLLETRTEAQKQLQGDKNQAQKDAKQVQWNAKGPQRLKKNSNDAKITTKRQDIILVSQ